MPKEHKDLVCAEILARRGFLDASFLFSAERRFIKAPRQTPPMTFSPWAASSTNFSTQRGQAVAVRSLEHPKLSSLS